MRGALISASAESVKSALTLALAQLAVSAFALDSRRWTSVRIILSSKRLSSLSSESIKARASR